MFRFWAPRVWKFYVDTMGYLKMVYPHLRTADTTFAYPAMSYNFGPATATYEHLDHQNYAGGFCVVTALGDFDSTLGGHIFLRELGIVAEFPAGSSVLLPSAVINHGNVPINMEKGEYRASTTQYCAGGIIRWDDQGCQTQENMSDGEYECWVNMLEPRWEAALKRFSKVETLGDDHKWLAARDC